MTLSEQILCNRLLFVIIGGEKNNFNYEFKLKTRNNLPTKIYWKNIVDVALLFM